MTRWLIVLTAALAATCLLSGARADSPAAQKMRIGIYDTRSIAVAYARSSLMADRLKQMKQDRDAAKAAGDEKKVKEIEARGAALQRQLHRQGFSNMPVDDLMSSVKDVLPQVAKDANVSAIAPRVNFSDDGSVEVVDVTDKLVAVFKPDEKTTQIIAELKNHPPVDLDELEKTHTH
jgi:hypothetical protein